MVEFEVFIDLLCPDSKDTYAVIQEFLAMPYLAGSVKDAIKINYSLVPLPYHHGTWIASKVMPYLIDQCIATPSQCKTKEYIQFAFAN